MTIPIIESLKEFKDFSVEEDKQRLVMQLLVTQRVRHMISSASELKLAVKGPNPLQASRCSRH